MNHNILLPRRTRQNPNWLRRIARWAGQQRRKIALYRFYRGLHNSRADSWSKAGRTL